MAKTNNEDSIQKLNHSYQHAKLRSDVLSYMVQHDDDPIELLKNFVVRLRNLFRCDQVIYCDEKETRVISNSSTAEHIWAAPIEHCRNCAHFDIHSKVFVKGVSEVPDCRKGKDGIPVNPECPVKSMLTRIVYCDGKPVGYISVHYINYFHEFSDWERETLAGFADILSLALSRYEAKKVNAELQRREHEKELEKSAGIASAIENISENYDYVVFVNTEKNEATRLKSTGEFDELIDSLDPNLQVFQKIDAMFNALVYAGDYEMFRQNTKRQHVEEVLSKEKIFKFECRMLRNGRPEYYRIKISAVPGIPKAYVIGLLNIHNDVLLKEKLKSEQMEIEHLDIIQSLSIDFDCINYVRIQKNKIDDVSVPYRISEKLVGMIPHWGDEMNFSKRLDLLKNYFVMADDQEEFHKKTRRQVILDNLKKQKVYYVNFKAHDGATEVYYQMKFAPVCDDKGTMYAIIAGLHNVDDEIRAEMKRRADMEAIIEKRASIFREEIAQNVISDEGLELMSEVAEAIPTGFFVYHAKGDGEIVFFNDLLVRTFGCETREEFIELTKNTFKGLVHPEDYDHTENMIWEQLASNEEKYDHVQYRITRKDGAVRILDDYGHLVHSKSLGDIFFVTAADVTDYSFLYENNQKEQALNGMTVLLADDDDFSRSINREILEIEGARVIEVSNGAEAVKCMNSTSAVDFILMDVVMPVMGGVEAIREIRKMQQNTKLPIIAFTADVSDEVREECLRAGADDFTAKPLNIVELSKKLVACMKRNSEQMSERLKSAMQMANTDALTHVKNSTAFMLKVGELEKKTKEDPNTRFAVVMCDINNLKEENDTYGHDAGDIYIKNCCKVICDVFKNSPVYRIGGDEFCAILEGEAYEHRTEAMRQLFEAVEKRMNLKNYAEGKASLAGGIAQYIPLKGETFGDVLKRADESMYRNKAMMKK